MPHLTLHRASRSLSPVFWVWAFALFFTGCATSDSVRVAHMALDRAQKVEPSTAFFGPVLARLTGAPAPRGPSPQARQHYVSIIFHLEGLGPADENMLKREGKLGDAFVLKTLALWRLGRLGEARASALRARASDQEALGAEERTLFRAFEGIAKLEAGLDAVAESKPYDEIHTVLAGDVGAWRVLGGARTEVTREHPLQGPLIQTRLGAFHALKVAREKSPASAETSAMQSAWVRLRAEAQVELAEFAGFPAPDAAAHRAAVHFWQERCGLDPVSR